jgi:hypothetical protein
VAARRRCRFSPLRATSCGVRSHPRAAAFSARSGASPHGRRVC